MADSTDISRGSFNADPFVDRVMNSQADTVYVPVEEMPGFDPEEYDVNTEEQRLSAQDHHSLMEQGVHAVYDVVRHAWAFKRGVPEESARRAASTDIHEGAASSFGDLPGATDILPPGAPVEDVVVPEGEPTPVIGAAQAAYPPEVITENPQRTNPVQATPSAVNPGPLPEKLNMPAEDIGEDGHPVEGRAPETAPGDTLNNPEPDKPVEDPNVGGAH